VTATPRVAILCEGEPAGSIDTVADRAVVSVHALRDAPPEAFDPDIVYLTEAPDPAWAAALASAPSLTWVHWGGVGIDGVALPDGVRVTTSRGVLNQAMAEYAVMLTLAALRGLWETREQQAHQVWAPRPTRRLADSRVVVLGAGSIGRATADALRALGGSVRLVGTARRADEVYGEILGPEDLDAALPLADVLIVTLPSTPATRGLVDSRVFDRLRDVGYLINIGRGAVVDESALVDALRSGRLSGAALDVASTEPLPPDHPLWSEPGVLISPHMSASAEGDWDRLLELFVQNLDRHLAGQPLLNVIDVGRGFVATESTR